MTEQRVTSLIQRLMDCFCYILVEDPAGDLGGKN